MATFPCTFLDVFTDTPLAGNGLAVVHDADGLDEATMLRFARRPACRRRRSCRGRGRPAPTTATESS